MPIWPTNIKIVSKQANRYICPDRKLTKKTEKIIANVKIRHNTLRSREISCRIMLKNIPFQLSKC